MNDATIPPSPKELLLFVKKFLMKVDSSLTLDDLDVDTDMVQYGVESINILSILTEIEAFYGISLSLEKLQKHCYEFSVNTILDVILTKD